MFEIMFMLHPILWSAGRRPADPANDRFFRGNFENPKILKIFHFFTLIQFDAEIAWKHHLQTKFGTRFFGHINRDTYI